MTGVIQYDRLADNVLQRLDRIERQLAHLAKWAAPIAPASILQFVLLDGPLGSANFDGDSFNDVSPTLLDMGTEFGAPSNMVAVMLKVSLRDSGSAANDCNVGFNVDGGSNWIEADCSGLANDQWERDIIILKCTPTGDLYYQINTSGGATGTTLDLHLHVWGYWVYI